MPEKQKQNQATAEKQFAADNLKKLRTTMDVYAMDLRALEKVMKKGEFFRDRFHNMVVKEIKTK